MSDPRSATCCGVKQLPSAVQYELRVAGSHGMSAVDYPAMLAMITDGRLDLAELIAERIPLEQAGAAMMAMDNPVAPRAGITVAVSDTGG